MQSQAHDMGQHVAACRDVPIDVLCALPISGEESEVVVAATRHALSAHGRSETNDVTTWFRQNLKDEITV